MGRLVAKPVIGAPAKLAVPTTDRFRVPGLQNPSGSQCFAARK